MPTDYKPLTDEEIEIACHNRKALEGLVVDDPNVRLLQRAFVNIANLKTPAEAWEQVRTLVREIDDTNDMSPIEEDDILPIVLSILKASGEKKPNIGHLYKSRAPWQPKPRAQMFKELGQQDRRDVHRAVMAKASPPVEVAAIDKAGDKLGVSGALLARAVIVDEHGPPAGYMDADRRREALKMEPNEGAARLYGHAMVMDGLLLTTVTVLADAQAYLERNPDRVPDELRHILAKREGGK